MSEALQMLAFGVIIGYLAFIGGCLLGRQDVDDLEAAGYRIVRHEIKHGNFHTNWLEVVKGEEPVK